MPKKVIKKTDSYSPAKSTPEAGEAFDERASKANVRTKRQCVFCASRKVPSYVDSASLKRYMSDRSRIQPKARTGVCAKHQRVVTREIKHARHLSLLPFVASIK